MASGEHTFSPRIRVFFFGCSVAAILDYITHDTMTRTRNYSGASQFQRLILIGHFFTFERSFPFSILVV